MLNGPQREAVQLTPEEARIVARLQEYRAKFPRHAAECLRVVNKESRLVPLTLNKPQLIIQAKIEAQRERIGMVRAIILKGRKQGASTLIGGRFYSRTRLWRHQHAKVMAHTKETAEVLFRMVKTYHQYDPLALQADNSSAKLLKFSNSSSYSVATAGGSGEAGRGDTPTLAHMSEVAFFPNAKKNYAALANSVPLAPGTEVFAESTANGVGNEFHVRWSLAEGGLNADEEDYSYIPIFMPWFISDEYRLPPGDNFRLREDPEGEGLPSEREVAEIYGLDNGQMAWRRFQIQGVFGGSVETFMQEYPNTPAEAFQTPGLDLFIKPIYVARARRRTGTIPYGPKILGVDPAGHGGDKFSMTLRQGFVVHWHRGRPGVEPGEEQVEMVREVMITENVDRVNIDYSGGWGTALLAGMRERYPKLAEKCHPIDFNGKSQAKMVNPHKPGPRNRRAEMYMRGRDWLQDPAGPSIPDTDELQSDLGAIAARITGQVTDTILESKVDVKSRLGRSPDTADSWALTFAVPDRVVQTSLTESVPAGNSRFDEGVVPTQPEPVIDPWSTGGGFDSGGGWMV